MQSCACRWRGGVAGDSSPLVLGLAIDSVPRRRPARELLEERCRAQLAVGGRRYAVLAREQRIDWVCSGETCHIPHKIARALKRAARAVRHLPAATALAISVCERVLHRHASRLAPQAVRYADSWHGPRVVCEREGLATC